MARRARLDGPDTWHHLMNRGIAKRPLFETDADRRFFCSLLAREVRAGRLEIHADCLMLTHFHLLVRSVNGELSEAMRRIQNRYARWFNRTRKRDGPLFRGRFLSRRINSWHHRRNVLIYIHDNPVSAGLVADGTQYEWSSAFHFARDKRPAWLETSWVDAELLRRNHAGTRSEQLAAAFPSRVEDDFRHWVESQLSARLPDEIRDDVSLKHAGSPRVVRWAMRKAKLADGTKPFLPVCRAGLVYRILKRAKEKVGPLLGLFPRKWKDGWVALRAGLLRLLSGCTHDEIGLRVGRHQATVSRDVKDHERLCRSVPRYERLAARLAHAALAARP